MITGVLIGDKQLIARLSAFPERAKADMDATVAKLGYGLQALVQRDYLTGQVLRVRTGRLRTSISQGQPDSRSRFESTAVTSMAYVGTNVWYGVMWETTGHEAYDVVPKRGKALKFTIGGETLFRRRVHIPAAGPRPYLQPALQAFTPFAMTEIKGSLTRTAQAVFAK